MDNPPEKPHPIHPMKHFTPFRLTTCAIAASALALNAFGTASLHFNRSSIGELTADALRESTKLDAQFDFFEAFGHALKPPSWPMSNTSSVCSSTTSWVTDATCPNSIHKTSTTN
jgi:hypothetical protein